MANGTEGPVTRLVALKQLEKLLSFRYLGSAETHFSATKPGQNVSNVLTRQ
jgi:hypothetical protein